jgi:glutathione peroxidase
MQTIDGKEKRLADYAGRVLLLINTASRCGYTPQYATLERLYEKFRDRGFSILAFPANNFGAQEPGSNAEIRTFCETHYHVTFDLFSKISARGDDIHPLYRYLTTESGFNGEIPWNFTKFLADKSGKVIARFEPGVDPMSDTVVQQIEALLGS